MECVRISRLSKNYIEFYVLLNGRQIGTIYYLLEKETNHMHAYPFGYVTKEIVNKTDVIARRVLMDKNDIEIGMKF